jgi:xanthine dehydrogenase accessory factor
VTEGLLETALRLERAGEPFVLAIVVRAEKPTSAKPGAKVIITKKGEWVGWIGGSCSQPAVEYEAQRAMATGEPRFLSLSSTETCASGGALDIYLEPHMPKPHLVVIGHLPIAEAVVTFAKPLGFRVTAVTLENGGPSFDGADAVVHGLDLEDLGGGEETYVVIASHGTYDAEAIEAALSKTKSDYVALVSSRKRAQALIETMKLSDDERARLKYPAGLDIGAVAPEEIALSIVAEIVSLRHRQKKEEEEAPAVAKDPVCGMMVPIATARYTLERDGETFYFCGAGCKESFAHAH